MLKISRDAYLQMKYFTQECESEIYGWLIGDVRQNQAHVQKIIVNEQTASGSDCELDADALEEFILEHDDNENVIGWWHSHNTMNTFWSSTDDENIERLIKSLGRVISIVSSEQGGFHMRAREDVWTLEDQIEFDEIDYRIETVENDDIKEKCQDIIEEKVDSSSYRVSSGKSKNLRDYYYGGPHSRYSRDSWWMNNSSKSPALKEEESDYSDYEIPPIEEQIESDDWVWSVMRDNFVHIDEMGELYSMPMKEREKLEETKVSIEEELEYLTEDEEKKLKEYLGKVGEELDDDVETVSSEERKALRNAFKGGD